MPNEKDEEYIKYCLRLQERLQDKDFPIQEEEALHLLQFKEKTFPNNKQDITTHYHKLALIYHPDKNPGDEVRCQCVFRCICYAKELLKNKDASRNTKYSCYSASAYKSDFDPKWSDKVSIILTSLAEEGIAELKQSSPDVFNKTFLSKQKLVIPASTLVMKGFVRLIKIKNCRYLKHALLSIGRFISTQDRRRISIDIRKLAPDFTQFICNTDVSWFDIYSIAQLAAQSMGKGSPVLIPGILDVNVYLNRLAEDTRRGISCLNSLDEKQRNISETRMNKCRLTRLHSSFKKRAIDPKSGKFKTKKDRLKSDLFEQTLAKQSVSSREVEEVVNTYTDRHTFGLFRFRPPTSKKEYDALLSEYQARKFSN